MFSFALNFPRLSGAGKASPFPLTGYHDEALGESHAAAETGWHGLRGWNCDRAACAKSPLFFILWKHFIDRTAQCLPSQAPFETAFSSGTHAACKNRACKP